MGTGCPEGGDAVLPPGPRTCTHPADGRPAAATEALSGRDCCHPSCPTQGPWGRPTPHLQRRPPQRALPAVSRPPAAPCPLRGAFAGHPPGLRRWQPGTAQIYRYADLSSAHGSVRNHPELLLLHEPFPWDLPAGGDTVPPPSPVERREVGGHRGGTRVSRAESGRIWAAVGLKRFHWGSAQLSPQPLGSGSSLVALGLYPEHWGRWE